VKLTSMAASSRGWGHILTVGQGDTGQLGLGENIMKKTSCLEKEGRGLDIRVQ
jgi:hypothetical protein